MLKQFVGTVKIGPGTLEDIIVEGLKAKGMLPKDATVQSTEYEYRTFFDKQKKVPINSAIVTFKSVEKDS